MRHDVSESLHPQRWIMALAALFLLSAAAVAQNWPSFRGPQATGIADGQNPPVAWDGNRGINIRWRTPIPGLGHSSPNRFPLAPARANAKRRIIRESPRRCYTKWGEFSEGCERLGCGWKICYERGLG